jgi:hypothetical protein
MNFVKLRIVPTSLEEANLYVSRHHRHHDPVTGHKFSIAVADDSGKVRGVAIVGRPVSRMSDNGWTLEVNRCCSDGTQNVCSMLYRASWRAAKAMGYTRLITYTLPDEGGSSLKGAGFNLVGERGGGTWSRRERPRVDTHPTQTKLLWDVQSEHELCDACGVPHLHGFCNTSFNIQHEETGRLQEWPTDRPIPHGWVKVSEVFSVAGT